MEYKNEILKENENIYTNYEWLYNRFVVDGMNQDEIASICGCKKRTIKKWLVTINKFTCNFRSENVKLNDIQKDLIVGSLLGDGHIDKRENSPIFIVSHAENQKDYLYFKYEILKNICNKKPSFIKGGSKEIYSKIYKYQNSYRISTRVVNELDFFRKKSRFEIIDMLNEFSLSIFFLDDGHRACNLWSICVASFSSEEKDFFIKYTHDKFGIHGYINKDNRYIHFRRPCSKIIDKIILKNIDNKIDVVVNKLKMEVV